MAEKLTVFLCTGKECRRAWKWLPKGSPGKWLKRQVEDAGLPYRLHIIKTDCMDHCDEAACLCLVHHDCARLCTHLRSAEDADLLLANLHALIELAEAGARDSASTRMD